MQSTEIPANWREATLGEVIELKRGYDLPQRERLPGPVPLVSSSGITDFHTVAKVKGPGVVTGRYGTLGKVFFVLDDFWPLNTTLYVRDFKGNDPRFISFLLRTLEFLAYSDKAAVPGLNRNHLHQEVVRLPPVEEQRAIAGVLGTLDDRIELSKRMGTTLKEVERALFRSWFVNFDPVLAKVKGRPSGLPPSLDALFPASFEGSDLGEIPAGWDVSTIGDEVELAYGRALKSTDRRPGPVTVMGSNGQIGEHDTALARGPGVVVGRKGNPGLVHWVSTDFWPIDTTFYVQPRGQLTLEYLHQALAHLNLPSLASDSAVPGVNRSFIYGTLTLVPRLELVRAFSGIVEPLWQLSAQNEARASTLAGLRDALLPELLSGRILARSR